MARQTKTADVKVDATVHRKAQRKNIPTAELEAFTEEDERQPKMLLYPRDPSLDPQLVWKGKDEQDRRPLAVPSVPIYIQEKISPQALIEELRAENARKALERQIELFSDFNGLPFDQLVDFYQHDQKWTNRMILGDSLLVMASLAEKEGLKGKVQMIYVDPPYGIKFGSNWQVSTRKRDVADGKPEDATRQPEQVQAFRDTWRLGVNSYLAYLRDRFSTARDLLADSGSIFVQIGDENLHLVRSVLDEVFGRDNFISVITVVKTSAQEDRLLPQVCDYILWFARIKESVKYRPLWLAKTAEDAGTSEYNRVQLSDGTRRKMTDDEASDWQILPAGARPYRQDNLVSQRPPGDFPVEFDGEVFRPITGYWKTGISGMRQLIAAHRIEKRGRMLSYVRFFDDFPVRPLANFWSDARFSSRSEDKTFVVQTSARILERCMVMTTDPGDLVVDPTCGSGTTAFVAEQLGRRWITIDTSRVALALARTRIMAARFPYFILLDSYPGAQKAAELSGGSVSAVGPFASDVSKGFVYERVPHVALKSIANNPEIRDGMSKPEVDAAIMRHADTEFLYDRPVIDPKIVRVSGPFTVESLSPHRVLAAEGGSGGPSPQENDATRFVERIVQYLRKAGVQNTVKNERLVFERLDQWPGGVYIQAAGEYAENGKSRTAAVAIGPEYGTVGPEFLREAAKEAVKFADLLVVCGFAFEPIVGEETTHLGRLTILKARMNPDLSMGDELLKKTGAGNLFMVFGEPDIRWSSVDGDLVTTEILGVDVYDPTTGVIRSHSTDDIACWFLDTNYNGNSFFVRHAYFLGGNDPYEKLRRALRAEIDEAIWSTLHATKSRPFPKPESGKIAVKVINHYGDEVMRVFAVN